MRTKSTVKLHWRAFCEVCDWHVEEVADRAAARAKGREHSEAEHHDAYEFRVQGLIPSTSWEVFEDDPRDEDSNTDRARKILEMVHQLEAVPWTPASPDDDVFVHLASCQMAIESLVDLLALRPK